MKILLVTHTYSGSNSIAFYKIAKRNHWDEIYHLDIVDESELQNKIKEEESINYLKEFSIVMTTFNVFRFSPNQVVIQSWHGFPIKTLGLMDKVDSRNLRYINNVSSANIILSYSKLYNILINASFPTFGSKYKITGMPRNDLLASPNYELINRLKPRNSICDKNVVYMPTYRRTFSRKDSNSSVLELTSKFLSNDFQNFLIQNNICFYIKPHPFEEIYIKNTTMPQNFSVIYDADFRNMKCDFYEILGYFDLLITDFSSVYFDWLLLNKPVIFFLHDVSSYVDGRNIMLDPIEFWLAGPICIDVKCVRESIQKFLLFGKDDYYDHRKIIKQIVHAYDDFYSSFRVFEIISKLIIK